MMDADLATDIRDFDKFTQELKKIELNGLGLVAGSRNHLVEEVTVKRKWYRNFLMKAAHFVIQNICGVQIKVVVGDFYCLQDTQCGFKLFTRSTSHIIFRVLHLERWAFDVELFMIARNFKVRVAILILILSAGAGERAGGELARGGGLQAERGH